jgi:hypothetical protein
VFDVRKRFLEKLIGDLAIFENLFLFLVGTMERRLAALDCKRGDNLAAF